MRGHAGGAAFIRVRSSSLPLPSLPCPACRPSPFSAARDSRVRPHFATTMMTMRMMTTTRRKMKKKKKNEKIRCCSPGRGGTTWPERKQSSLPVCETCATATLPPSERPTGAILRKCTRQLKAEPLPKGLSDVLSRRFSISISSSFSFSSSSSSPPPLPPFSLSSYSLFLSLASSLCLLPRGRCSFTAINLPPRRRVPFRSLRCLLRREHSVWFLGFSSR